MIDKVFFQILNMSFASSFAIMFVLFARLILKKVPKVFSYTLWSVVLFRLICPVSFESTFSLLPINVAPVPIATIYSESPQISTGITAFDHAIHSILPVPSATASSNPLQIWIFVGEIVWLAGMALLIGHSVASLMRLRQKLIGAVRLQHNIYLVDHITTPFVFGLISPKIYLPSTLSERERGYIILHEQMHIRHFDYIIEASNPVPTPLLGHRCRSSQEITGSPTPFSTSNHYLWICPRASFSLSNPNIAA